MKENYEFWAAYIKREEEEQTRAPVINMESDKMSTSSLKVTFNIFNYFVQKISHRTQIIFFWGEGGLGGWK